MQKAEKNIESLKTQVAKATQDNYPGLKASDFLRTLKKVSDKVDADLRVSIGDLISKLPPE